MLAIVMFAWLISRTFLANEHYFSLTTNQPTVLLAMTYQPSEQGTCRRMSLTTGYIHHARRYLVMPSTTPFVGGVISIRPVVPNNRSRPPATMPPVH